MIYKVCFLHWDWLSPAELNRRALSEKEDDYYLIICSWDKHHFAIKEISDSVLWVSSPALSGKWKYDSNLALSSLPWALEFIKNNDWLVDIIVKRYR